MERRQILKLYELTGDILIVNLNQVSKGVFVPSSEVDQIRMERLAINKHYSVNIKENQNYQLHKKIFAFFGFCANWYFGDCDAHLDKDKVEFMRDKLTIFAGHYAQIFLRDGGFELRAKSINYASMTPEDRSCFYKKIVDVALERVFNNCNDENMINRLISFF